jgi:hypothetical protein
MKTITIYGASDDLIEIEGDIREEFYANEDGITIAVSDGTLLSIEYDSGGFWRVNRLVAGSATMEKTEATDPDDDYSDKVTLTGDIRWIVVGQRAILKP